MEYLFVFLLAYIIFMIIVYEEPEELYEEPEEQVYPIQAVLYDHNGHPVFVNDVEKIKEKHNDSSKK